MVNATLLLEQSIYYNFDSAVNKYTNILRAMGTNTDLLSPSDVKIKLGDKIKDLRLEIGIDFTLEQLGIRKTELKKMDINAFNDVCIATNPKNISIKNFEKLYEKIF